MQTKHDIERLLGASGLNPNTSLGQHFLIDLNLMRLLVEQADIGQSDVVLEAGPGTGSLTEALCEQAGRVVAVEYDTHLYPIAKAAVNKYDNAEVIRGDVLESKSRLNTAARRAVEAGQAVLGGRFKLVSNLPYHASTPLMIILATSRPFADEMYVTVQKEVGERMTAAPGCKQYGPLSIFLQATGDVKIFHKLGREVFWPRPDVQSVMISFVRNEKRAGAIEDMEMFRQVVNLFMGHRRKMLKACCKFAEGKLAQVGGWGEIFEKAGVDPKTRPEKVAVGKFVEMANICVKIVNHQEPGNRNEE